MLIFLYTYIRLKFRILYLLPLGFMKMLRGQLTWNKWLGQLEMNKVENRLCFWKTIYFCLRTMPFKYAIHTPIWIYGKNHFFDLSGRVLPSNSRDIQSGMMKIGLMDQARSISDASSFTISGEVIFGENVVVRQGAKWKISGKLVLGSNCMISDNVTLFVGTNVTLEDSCVVAFNSIVMDSDIHYMVDVNTMTVKNNCSPIYISRGTWIGSYTMIKKGTKLPPYTIVVGPYSSLGKDYTQVLPNYSMIGGNPAKYLKSGLREINNGTMELFLNKYFQNHSEPFTWNGDLEHLCTK